MIKIIQQSYYNNNNKILYLGLSFNLSLNIGILYNNDDNKIIIIFCFLITLFYPYNKFINILLLILSARTKFFSYFWEYVRIYFYSKDIIILSFNLKISLEINSHITILIILVNFFQTLIFIVFLQNRF